MDFRTATHIAATIEKKYPDVTVAGIKEMHRPGKRPGWVLDVVHRETGKMVTLDEKDYWPQRIASTT